MVDYITNMVAFIRGGRVLFKFCKLAFTYSDDTDWIRSDQSIEDSTLSQIYFADASKADREYPQSQNKLQAFLIASDFIGVWTYCLSIQCTQLGNFQ